MTKNKNKIVADIVTYVLLAFFALLVLIPFYIIIITSLKTNTESTSLPFTWWPREGFHFDGFYKVLFNDASGGGDGASTILRGFLNTLWIVTPTTIIGLLASSLSGYSFAKINFRIKNLLFSILLATMMIPSVIMLTPSYLLYNALGLVDSPIPLMLPGMFGAAACVFFMRQFFSGIPTELVEAGKIDGMNHFSIFFKVMVPLSMPALVAQGILGFLGGYNDYFGPLLYLKSPELYTLQIALKFSMGTYNFDWQAIMAGSVIALAPILVLYFFAQKFFIQGIAMSGLKV